MNKQINYCQTINCGKKNSKGSLICNKCYPDMLAKCGILIEMIPYETLINIMTLFVKDFDFTPKDILNIMLTCKKWNDAITQTIPICYPKQHTFYSYMEYHPRLLDGYNNFYMAYMLALNSFSDETRQILCYCNFRFGFQVIGRGWDKYYGYEIATEYDICDMLGKFSDLYLYFDVIVMTDILNEKYINQIREFQEVCRKRLNSLDIRLKKQKRVYGHKEYELKKYNVRDIMGMFTSEICYFLYVLFPYSLPCHKCDKINLEDLTKYIKRMRKSKIVTYTLNDKRYSHLICKKCKKVKYGWSIRDIASHLEASLMVEFRESMIYNVNRQYRFDSIEGVEEITEQPGFHSLQEQHSYLDDDSDVDESDYEFDDIETRDLGWLQERYSDE